jgi:hypothetical protein
MPDLTPKLKLKKPLGNETVNRVSYNENLTLIDKTLLPRPKPMSLFF